MKRSSPRHGRATADRARLFRATGKARSPFTHALLTMTRGGPHPVNIHSEACEGEWFERESNPSVLTGSEARRRHESNRVSCVHRDILPAAFDAVEAQVVNPPKVNSRDSAHSCTLPLKELAVQELLPS